MLWLAPRYHSSTFRATTYGTVCARFRPGISSNGLIGNTTWAAITAVVAANIVLVAYIMVSMREEKQAASVAKAKAGGKAKPETKKTQ